MCRLLQLQSNSFAARLLGLTAPNYKTKVGEICMHLCKPKHFVHTRNTLHVYGKQTNEKRDTQYEQA